MMTSLASQDVEIVLPSATATMLCERAAERWGNTQRTEGWRTVVQVWSSGTASSRRALGTFSIEWATPVQATASIVRLTWDPSTGSSSEQVRWAINALAGWPIARDRSQERQGDIGDLVRLA